MRHLGYNEFVLGMIERYDGVSNGVGLDRIPSDQSPSWEALVPYHYSRVWQFIEQPHSLD
jgi:hypothetical protein